jgi:cbb3-type cytochrome oxidase subunit 3
MKNKYENFGLIVLIILSIAILTITFQNSNKINSSETSENLNKEIANKKSNERDVTIENSPTNLNDIKNKNVGLPPTFYTQKDLNKNGYYGSLLFDDGQRLPVSNVNLTSSDSSNLERIRIDSIDTSVINLTVYKKVNEQDSIFKTAEIDPSDKYKADNISNQLGDNTRFYNSRRFKENEVWYECYDYLPEVNTKEYLISKAKNQNTVINKWYYTKQTLSYPSYYVRAEICINLNSDNNIISKSINYLRSLNLP